jgi:hypothetical protein
MLKYIGEFSGTHERHGDSYKQTNKQTNSVAPSPQANNID